MTDPQSPVGLSIPLNQPRPDFYSRSYFQGLSRITALNERAIWAVISILGKPEGYLDLGCGDGSMVAAINSISGGLNWRRAIRSRPRSGRHRLQPGSHISQRPTQPV